MTHYRVVTASTPEALTEAVEKMLASGWWTVGGVSVTHSPGDVGKYYQWETTLHNLFAQALTLTDREPLPIEEKQEVDLRTNSDVLT